MLQSIYKEYVKNYKVSTDTRKIEGGEVFFALKGPNFNANSMAEQAIEKGAIAAVIDDSSYKKDDRYILVDDALKTLQDLALHHRLQLNIPIIGLTGSNGKTTTKELIKAVLDKKFKVLATQGNLNNHIGVPLTLLSITPEHEIAIIEMGANHVGEIKRLCEIAFPSHGMITNIGKAHLEGFGGIEGVIRGKSELYDHLIKSDGTVWINSTNHILSNMAKRFKAPYFYPAEEDYYNCTLIQASPYLKLQTGAGETIQTQLVGTYNFENIAAALCIGKYFEVDEEQANKAVEEYNPQNNRSQIISRDSNTIILDAYNANPSSMKEAVENLKSMEAKKKVAVLGDMNELGEDSIKEHLQLGQHLKEAKFDDVYLCGKHIKSANESFPESFYYEDKKELLEVIKNKEFADTLFLIKASRSIGLEEVVEYI